MEIIAQYEEENHVRMDVHRIMLFHEQFWIIHRENCLLCNDNISKCTAMNKHDNKLIVLVQNNQHLK
jgi:hypothetical protein